MDRFLQTHDGFVAHFRRPVGERLLAAGTAALLAVVVVFTAGMLVREPLAALAVVVLMGWTPFWFLPYALRDATLVLSSGRVVLYRGLGPFQRSTRLLGTLRATEARGTGRRTRGDRWLDLSVVGGGPVFRLEARGWTDADLQALLAAVDGLRAVRDVGAPPAALDHLRDERT